MYECARCGQDSIEQLDEPEEENIEQPREGWCDNCGDHRPIVE